MRILIKTSPNNRIVPFEYQQLLTGTIHKWLGNNEYHDNISLYSFSWLKNGKADKKGINFFYGASFFISAYDSSIIKRIIEGIQKSPEMFFGLVVNEITIQENPLFQEKHRFLASSPIFIKRKESDRIQFYYYDNQESSIFLTETLQNKLRQAGLDDTGVQVYFDNSFLNPSKKGTTYKGIKSVGSVCPIIVEGTSEQISFAWNVGVGNSTGIGFGALI